MKPILQTIQDTMDGLKRYSRDSLPKNCLVLNRQDSERLSAAMKNPRPVPAEDLKRARATYKRIGKVRS